MIDGQHETMFTRRFDMYFSMQSSSQLYTFLAREECLTQLAMMLLMRDVTRCPKTHGTIICGLHDIVKGIAVRITMYKKMRECTTSESNQ